ncbi:MAG TPA: dTDP-4-dehydrorhamnose 3,5-epimerase [Clostridiales bacterium]|nr:MAG: dTDP-4-dehydrorhamnose 3,5-epimerase [Clostridiales bacterium GWD2_32_19]HCC08188.1 dTDP-4-dehydrorhamnose 3,5-epimerase [Clostridiales bacterium]
MSKFTETYIKGLYVIEPSMFKDARGYFFESYNQKDFHKNGIDANFKQDNESYSRKGILRGLHFQKEHQQGKLVRVIKGTVYDVAVDLRKYSLMYGRYYSVILSEENKKQFYIPEGFAHGFLVLSDEAIFSYKCTDFYYKDEQGGILWNDHDIGIDWPVKGINEIILNERDQSWSLLRECRVEL